MRIALDAMGGDRAPGPIVLGAVQAVAEIPDITVTLVGDQAQIEAVLPPGTPRDRLSIVHCTQVVAMDDSPVDGLRKKPDNSISRTWQQLAEGKVDAVVSAGNTGAMVAGGLRLRKFLPMIERPGIATLMPTAKGTALVLDVGANIHPKPLHLFQYGVMGSIFAKNILKIDNPKIGLMNVGEEESKGTDLTKSTHQLFTNSPLREQFIGNIEGRDIHRGACDVIVTDGFVGNVVLKLCEGVFEFIMKMVAKEIVGPLQVEKMQAGAALQQLVGRYDYRSFGGAPLLGIDGICIICHGSSDERAIKNALAVAAKHAREGLNAKITAELSRVAATPEIGNQ
jgi:glycerol-3-phosphate acyltransferase PlsX